MARLNLSLAPSGFLFDLLFYPEDGSDIFPQNVKGPSNYMVLQLRRF
jgi:hypothetical protein